MKFIRLLLVCWRSCFVQTSWNFNNMQGIGFFYTAWPMLRRLDLAPEHLRRHAQYFNTNPYVAGLVVGVALHYEERGEELSTEYKSSLASFLGAAGDGLFWATLRPALFGLGVLLYLLEPVRPLAFWVPLCTYALITLGVRFWALQLGYRYGIESINHLRPDAMHRLVVFLKHSHSVLAGMLVMLVAYGVLRNADTEVSLLATVLLVLILALFHFMRVNLFLVLAAILLGIVDLLNLGWL